MIALLLCKSKLHNLKSFNELSSAKCPDERQEHRYKLPDGSMLEEVTPVFSHWLGVSFSQMLRATYSSTLESHGGHLGVTCCW